jgi:hypothetical protein
MPNNKHYGNVILSKDNINSNNIINLNKIKRRIIRSGSINDHNIK